MKLPNEEIEMQERISTILDACADKLREVLGGNVFIVWNKQQQNLHGIEVLQSIICEVTKVQWHQIVDKSRQRELSIARHLYCWFANQKLHATKVSISRSINRDHTTVIHSVSLIDSMIFSKDEMYYPIFKEILKRLTEYAESQTEKAIA